MASAPQPTIRTRGAAPSGDDAGTSLVDQAARGLRGDAGVAAVGVRPDRRVMDLDELITYYGGVFRTTVALKGRFGDWRRSGKKAFREVDAYQQMVRRYIQALDETVKLTRQET